MTIDESAELCRCWHRFDQHTGPDSDEGSCTSPTIVVWHDGSTTNTACTCERFRYPDSDE